MFDDDMTTDPVLLQRRRRRSSAATSASFPGLLEACGYENDHPIESLDWLNVLIAQAVISYRNAILDSDDGPTATFERLLNRQSSSAPSLIQLDTIIVEEVNLGDNFPKLSNARARPTAQGSLVRIDQICSWCISLTRDEKRVDMELDYTDVVSISLSTNILLNVPKPRFAVLPVSLVLTVSSLSSALSLTVTPEPTPTVHISIEPDFEMQVTTRSLLGSKAKLQDLPKVEQILKERIRAVMIEKLVYPARVEIALPKLAPGSQPPATPASTKQEVASLQGDELFTAKQDDESPSDSIIVQDYGSENEAPPTPASFDMTNKGPYLHLHPHLRTFPVEMSSASGASTPVVPGSSLIGSPILNGNSRSTSISTGAGLSKLAAESEARQRFQPPGFLRTTSSAAISS